MCEVNPKRCLPKRLRNLKSQTKRLKKRSFNIIIKTDIVFDPPYKKLPEFTSDIHIFKISKEVKQAQQAPCSVLQLNTQLHTSGCKLRQSVGFRLIL